MIIQDLRKDNFIYVALPGSSEIMIPTCKVKVQGITIFNEIECLHEIQKEGFKIPLHHCMGIKITEQHLEDFGFTINSGWNKGPISVIVFNEHSTMVSIVHDHTAQQRFHTNIQFVHQLQNLYFDLTGELLEACS